MTKAARRYHELQAAIDELRADGAPIEDEMELVSEQAACWNYMTNSEQDEVWEEVHKRRAVGIHLPLWR